jgi:hypothetical protein
MTLEKLVAMSLLLLATGCARTRPIEKHAYTAVPERLGFIEANVLVSELDFDGQLIPREDWTRAGTSSVEAVVRARLRSNGAKSLQANGIEEEAYNHFFRWTDRALSQILSRLEGDAFPETKSVTQWRYEKPIADWQGLLGVTHLLVVRFRDAHQTTGRTVANLFGGVTVHARQVGIACVVNLSNGRIVWCEHKVTGAGDLRSAMAAKPAVDQLLKPLLPH